MKWLGTWEPNGMVASIYVTCANCWGRGIIDPFQVRMCLLMLKCIWAWMGQGRESVAEWTPSTLQTFPHKSQPGDPHATCVPAIITTWGNPASENSECPSNTFQLDARTQNQQRSSNKQTTEGKIISSWRKAWCSDTCISLPGIRVLGPQGRMLVKNSDSWTPSQIHWILKSEQRSLESIFVCTL